MTEIGRSLREARVRRGVELAEVEAATKIRAGYLAALEDERFDELPGRAYARAFLRTYAQYLGLQDQLLLDELAGRLTPDEPSMAPLPLHRPHRVPCPAVLVPLSVALIFVTLLAAGQFDSGTRSPTMVGLPSGAASRAGTPARPAPTSTKPRRAKLAPKAARVVLTAARGDCWLLVRIGSETAPVLYEHTLSRGSSTAFSRPRLWIRIGAPGSLSATLNGKPIDILPRNDHPTNILVGPGDVRVV